MRPTFHALGIVFILSFFASCRTPALTEQEREALFIIASEYYPPEITERFGDKREPLVVALDALEKLIVNTQDIEAYLIRKIESRDANVVSRVSNLLEYDPNLGQKEYSVWHSFQVASIIKTQPDQKAENLVRVYWELLNVPPDPEVDISLVYARSLQFFATRTSVPRNVFLWTKFNLDNRRPWIRSESELTPRSLARKLHEFQNEFENTKRQVEKWLNENGARLVYACFSLDDKGVPMPGNLATGVLEPYVGFCTLEQQTIPMGGRIYSRPK